VTFWARTNVPLRDPRSSRKYVSGPRRMMRACRRLMPGSSMRMAHSRVRPITFSSSKSGKMAPALEPLTSVKVARLGPAGASSLRASMVGGIAETDVTSS
jgi:hypothetical protein